MKDTKETILKKATEIFASQGYEAFSIRNLADEIPLAPSVLYHYFKDKDSLLREMYETSNRSLGQKRAKLSPTKTASEMLKQRIEFQFDNAEEIVAVLKYFIAYRNHFKKFEKGFIPEKSTLHIEEVLEFGVRNKEFKVHDLKDDSKVIAHAINGFLLEYYPYKPKGKEKAELINSIHNFILRSLKGGEK